MQRPQETLRQLVELFPGFEESWKAESAPPEDGLVDGVYYEWTHHRVIAEFLQYFSKHQVAVTEKQLKHFAAWVNSAVETEGPLENAVSTCFLEHSRQLKINQVLAPYLSKVARAKSHA